MSIVLQDELEKAGRSPAVVSTDHEDFAFATVTADRYLATVFPQLTVTIVQIANNRVMEPVPRQYSVIGSVGAIGLKFAKIVAIQRVAIHITSRAGRT